MAKTPESVRSLLDTVWKPARARALSERDKLQAQAAREGANITIEPWDWRYYAEKVKKAQYQVDQEALRPYFKQ